MKSGAPVTRSMSDAKGGIPAHRSDLLPHVMAGLTFVFAGWIVATTLYAVIVTYSPLPFWDTWREVTATQHIARLSDQHNEHRIVLSRLIFIADKLWFDGGNKLSLAATFLIQALHAALLVYLFSQARRIEYEEALAAWALAISMLFWLWQSETLAWGFNVHFAAVYALATAAFAVFALNGSGYGPFFALLLGGISAFTMANGLLVPLLLISLAIWLRRPWPQIALLMVGAIVIAAAFFAGYRTGVHEPEHGPALTLLAHAVRYAMAFLGGPFGVPVEYGARTLLKLLGGDLSLWRGQASIWFGAIGMVLFAGSGVYLLLHRREARPAQLALFHVMAFVMATALMTASGRMQLGLEQALSPRYGTPALVFWTATAFLLWSFLGARAKSAQGAVLTGAAFLGLFIACTQMPLLAYAREAALGRQEAETALLANVDDPDALRRLYNNLRLIDQQSELLKAEHLSVFARPWSSWLGAPISTRARVTRADRCAGFLDEIVPIDSSGSAAWRARGWAWDRAAGSVPEVIILTQAGGTIVGFGLPGYVRSDVQSTVGEVSSSRTGWRGHFSVARPTLVQAYALLEGGLVACPLQGPKEANASTGLTNN